LDFLVVGRRGMSRIKSLLLGSVSRQILRAAPDATVVIVS
jgi:nucleotide-binding universal stress UspA family protein